MINASVKNLVFMAFASAFAATAAAQSNRLSCNTSGPADRQCRLADTLVSNAVSPYHSVFSISYELTCYPNKLASTFAFTAGSNQSAPLSYGTSGLIEVEGVGPIHVMDSNPALTEKRSYNKGCSLKVLGHTRKLSPIGINQLADLADGKVATANAIIDRLTALESVKTWYDLYVAGTVNSAVLDTVITNLSTRNDPISRNQVVLLRSIQTEGAAVNIPQKITDAEEALMTARNDLEGIKAIFLQEVGSSREAIDGAIERINQFLS